MRLLIIGRLNGELVNATRIAMSRGAKVTQTDGIDQGMIVLRARGADLIMVDVEQSVSDLVAALELERIRTPIVACGTGTDAQAAVSAIRAGAKEYIPLPPDPEMIAAILEAVSSDAQAFVWRDPIMDKVVRLAEQVARSDASVMITGESGTGKEVLARFIHQKSLRRDKPFVSVNCAAIPDHLLESELFGHEKGAFTGAVARRIGKFEEADTGTLFLDEISEMDIRLQAKLLRALQERVIDRVGGKKPVPINIRVLATSNRTMMEEVRKGTFREDLMYRLNVVTIKLPSLRERPKDIVELANHFAKKYAQINGVSEKVLSLATRDALIKAPWRGNVRELENTIHRAVLLSTGVEIEPEALHGLDMDEPRSALASLDDTATRFAQTADAVTHGLVGRTVADVERALIINTLDHCLGNRTHAAKILGISIRTLRNKLNDYVAEGFAVVPPREGGRDMTSIAGGY
jgi:two-component system, response regulator FlrC